MREGGVLLAANGEHRNILKIRPPLVFGIEHADIVLALLDRALDKVTR
jgi:4-aminobutyrate aminotransferase-like enzyme